MVVIAGENRDWRCSGLGERVQHICELRGWSLNRLGQEAGVRSGPMSRLAAHEEPLGASPETLARIADAADVSLLWLSFARGPVETVEPAPGMLRLHPEWSVALREAKRRQHGIPGDIWRKTGDIVIQVPGVDWELVAGLAREIHSACLRAVE